MHFNEVRPAPALCAVTPSVSLESLAWNPFHKSAVLQTAPKCSSTGTSLQIHIHPPKELLSIEEGRVGCSAPSHDPKSAEYGPGYGSGTAIASADGDMQHVDRVSSLRMLSLAGKQRASGN